MPPPESTPSQGPRRRRPGLKARLVLLFVGLVLALGVGEIALRIFYGGATDLAVGFERENWRDAHEQLKGMFTTDEEFGFRPVLGTSMYSATGTRPNPYPLAKRPGITRILFVGDSVTFQSRIVNALSDAYPDPRYEFWNAGVTGFNTIQQLEWFKLANHQVEPDHVVLTFHNNDFAITPVAFFDDDGRLRVFSPDSHLEGVNPWLYENCYLYRTWRKALAAMRGPQSQETTALKVDEALRGFREVLAKKNITFTVALFPILDAAAKWTDDEKWSRAQATRICKKLGIRLLDMHDAAIAAIDEGLDIRLEPTDTWHPNELGGARLAESLLQQGLLPPLRDGVPPIGVTAKPARLSLSKGGQQQLTFHAGPRHAGRQFLVLGSISGTKPAIALGKHSLQLKFDFYTELLALHPNTVVANSLGRLDLDGKAQATVGVPLKSDPALAGVTVQHAFVVFEHNPYEPSAVSEPVTLRLVE